MLAHDLAALLLAGPNVPVVSGLNRTGWGEAVDSVETVDAVPYDETETEQVIDLQLSEESSHSSPGMV